MVLNTTVYGQTVTPLTALPIFDSTWAFAIATVQEGRFVGSFSTAVFKTFFTGERLSFTKYENH